MNFQQRTTRRYALSDEALEKIMLHAERIEAAKKQIIVEEGMRDDYVYFVERGSVRAYVMREDRCVILFFAFEGDMASAFAGEDGSSASRFTLETMEKTTLLRIPRARMEELLAGSVELANWGRRMVERWLRMDHEYFSDYAWREKGAQYELMLREYPELLQRVPLKDLAAYLMVTPQTLSRIRAEMK